MAIIAMTRLATDPLPVEALEELFKSDHSITNPLFGAESRVGPVPGREEAHEALASRASKVDAEVFQLLLKHPPLHRKRDDRSTRTFSNLGAAVRERPELVQVLLGADDTRRGGQTNRDFARQVFQFAGDKVLPLLHEALDSPDRVIRANAAAGCGAIGDSSSIPKLLKALDLESGLSKGAIVVALGELRAQEAIPTLAGLYVEARAAEKRRYSSGLQFAQAQVVVQQQRRELGSLENLKADWDELKASAERAKAPADPRVDEPLLSPTMVLTAIASIGPEHAQAFYRRIAADTTDRAGRSQAARHLGAAKADEQEASLAVLRTIAANTSEGYNQAAAGVSLVQLGDADAGRVAIATALGGEYYNSAFNVIWNERDEAKIQAAKKALKAISDDDASTDALRERVRSLLKRI